MWYHPAFKTVCNLCGNVKKCVYTVSVYNFRRCPTCDY